MHRRVGAILLLVTIVVAATVVSWNHYYNRYEINPGLSIPKGINLISIKNGLNLDMASVLQGKVSVIFYTSANCPVCRKQRSMLNSIPLEQKRNIQWVDVLANNYNLHQWFKKYGREHDYVLLDAQHGFQNALELDATPTLIIVDSKLKVLVYWRGYLSRASWDEHIQPVLLEQRFLI